MRRDVRRSLLGWSCLGCTCYASGLSIDVDERRASGPQQDWIGLVPVEGCVQCWFAKY